MSGDFETHEMNQPKNSCLKKGSENNTEWLDELINKIEDMKNKILILFNLRRLNLPLYIDN